MSVMLVPILLILALLGLSSAGPALLAPGTITLQNPLTGPLLSPLTGLLNPLTGPQQSPGTGPQLNPVPINPLDPCLTPLPPPYPLLLAELTVCINGSNTCRSFCVSSQTDAVSAAQQLENAGYLATGRQVVFIAHGYVQNDINGNWMFCIKDEILKVEDSTVIAVNWGWGADTPSYPSAAANTESAAKIIKDVANAILNTATFGGDASALYLYCIGHSLGSHVCGQAGIMSGIFDRVTGLDPAGPGMDTCPDWLHLRLNSSSATCVDTIHTEGGGYSYPGDPLPYWGTLHPRGHVDFYPNGGNASQPTCNYPHCSHAKAVGQFIKSINNPNSLVANGPCTDPWSLPASCSNTDSQSMGYYSSCHKSNSVVKQGNYYLTANVPSVICTSLDPIESCAIDNPLVK